MLSMRCTMLALLSTSVLSAQSETLYLRFDEPGSSTVLNMTQAGVTDVARFLGTPSSVYGKGVFGGSLAARGYGPNGKDVVLDTGFRGQLTGSATFAFFIRNRFANTPTIPNGLFGRGDLSMSSGGKAGKAA